MPEPGSEVHHPPAGPFAAVRPRWAGRGFRGRLPPVIDLLGTAGAAWTGIAAVAVAGIVYAYLGYPVVARLLFRPRPLAPPVGGDEPPPVSILVAARNEAGVIGRRIENLLGQDYPADRLEVLVASDASDDGTDEEVRRIADRDPRVRLYRLPRRGGKTEAINRIAPEARGEILVQTDANVMFRPDAVRALARAFRHPDVGVALGEVQFVNEDDPTVAGGEGLYWRFETWTKRVESERGLLCVANGGIYALRRSLWRPLPPNIAGDAAEPLLAAREGFRTVIAEGALAFERASSGLAEEFARKVRIISQQVACARWIGPFALPPRIAWAYVSHKLLRYAVPAMGLLAVVAGSVGASLGSPAGGALAVMTALPVVLAPAGLLPVPGAAGRFLRLCLYLVVINLAAVVGTARGLAGRAAAHWEVPASTRARETAGGDG